MELNPNSRSLALVLVLLLSLAAPTHEYVYSCDPNAACGCSKNPVSLNRIVGGEPAGTSTWGWIVSIYIEPGYLCGGSILSSTWIISAAHCFQNIQASQVTVYAGSNAKLYGQVRSVAALAVHPSYSRVTFQNDIALLRLATPLNMADPNVKIICMPSIGAADNWPLVGSYVVAAGWGKLTEGGFGPSYLQQVTLQIIDHRSQFCTPVSNDTVHQVCAGVTGGGKDTCQGDSGGPLMIFTSSKQWELVGLTSFGKGCARPSSAGVYTRVTYYHSWIRSITSSSFTTGRSSNSANINPFRTRTI